MAIFPKVDIDPDFAADASLRAQNQEAFRIMHQIAEDNVYPYSIMHRAIELTAQAALENEQLEHAITSGISAFEVLAGTYPGASTYETVAARALASAAPLLFVDKIRNTDDFIARVSYAHDRIQGDTPVLAEAVTDITSRQVGDDVVARRFALGAAGMMRSMQIFIDNRLQT